MINYEYKQSPIIKGDGIKRGRMGSSLPSPKIYITKDREGNAEVEKKSCLCYPGRIKLERKK